MKRNHAKLSLKGVMVVFAASALAACGGGESAEDRERKMEREAAKHGIDADVSVDENGEVKSVEIKSGAGVVGKNVALVKGFPEDIPVPSSWNVMMSAPAGGGAYTMQALSEDDADTIAAEVKTGMTEKGWSEIAPKQPAPTMRVLGFEKDGRLATFNIMANGATHVVQLSTMKKP